MPDENGHSNCRDSSHCADTMTPNAEMQSGRNSNIGQSAAGAPAGRSAKALGVLGTRLHATTYDKLISELRELLRQPRTTVVDFTNTQIVTLRRNEPGFRAITQDFDLFIPDGMPLIWCVNAQGAGLRDRVYGPTFMRHCILANAGTATHYSSVVPMNAWRACGRLS